MNAPTLLIGLGGIGCRLIEKVSQMVSGDQNSNIAFAVFDTDINELRGIQERNPLVRTIQTSIRQTVGEYLNRDTHARDTWFPVNPILNSKTLTEGAGQVRSISRLGLETVIKAGKMEPLHEAIQSLYKVEEDKIDQTLRVVICSSLAGGTGSGLILPVAMYVRNYLNTHFRQGSNITRGFFILPEVVYEVISSQSERNNLKANAYATLRELDAFLMKGDETLDERFKDSVKLQFPRIAADGYEEYKVRPYDYCFLFDAQNADGGKLNSFEQYLDHAANCIYAQSIGPMNKRSNSSEDNTIRALVRERGRNRYAGAGVSMLIYPFEDIKNMIALKWTQLCVSKQWLMYDNLFKELIKEEEEKRGEGLSVREQSLSTFYVNQIDASSKHDDPFAKAIVNSTLRFSNGVTQKAEKWMEYVVAINKKIERDLEYKSSDLTSMYEDINNNLFNMLSNEWEDYKVLFRALQEYRLLSESFAEEKAQSIGYSMFKGSRSSIEKGQDYLLETYLVSSENRFIHPNAIRYMLIKIRDLLKKEKEVADNIKAEKTQYFDEYERETFDDKETDAIETVDSLPDRKMPGINKITKKPSADQEEMKDSFRVYFNTIDEYRLNYTKSVVLGKGIDYINSLILAFESFYKAIDSKVEALDRRITDIYKKYRSTTGTTVRYVCASEECLNKIYERKPYTGSVISIDPELARSIYDKVLEYAMDKDKMNSNRFFNDLFDKNIVGYFEKIVMRDYGLDIDVDVITAIEKEADYEGKYQDADDADVLIDQYVRKTIRDTRNLSTPFIETPLGEERERHDSCTFNTCLIPEQGDESPRAQLIRKDLMNFGGAPDEDISKYRIMFYQSYYGLRANDLSKFAPPEKSMTHNRESGEYFKAYHELIQGVHPEPHKSKGISPHIDRWWHIITKMPDLDEENQKKQEYDIYAAFFWALIRKYVEIYEEGAGTKVYLIRNEKLKLDDNNLIVSNGTNCDKFYEILDAIAIYPELVEHILDDVETETVNDVNEGYHLEEGILFTGLSNFKIEEPGVGVKGEPSVSIFDLPMLIKKSSIPDYFFERNVIEMLKVEIEEVKRYISNFCNPKELPGIVGELIRDQFNKHLEAVEKEKEIHPTIYKESLFSKTCDVIVKTFSDLGLRKEAKELAEQVEGLKNNN